MINRKQTSALSGYKMLPVAAEWMVLMEMQIVAVPLFDRNMAVEAYLFRYRKGNDLFSASQTAGLFDGAARSPVLEALNLAGLDAFALGKQIFVPVKPVTLLAGLENQCKEPPDKIIFLFEEPFRPEEPYLSRIAGLREKGFRFALSKPDSIQPYEALLPYISFCILPQNEGKQERSAQLLQELKRLDSRIVPIASHIPDEDTLHRLQRSGYTLYESRFHRVPVTKGDNEVSPLKVNTIRLLNTVQDDNFDFEQVTSIVQRDPALTISLMRLVNNPQLGLRNNIKTISHAVAMLGQNEVRKWVTMAVSQSLGNDRPNEITRVSLIRAKFAENLAPLFELAHMAQGLFLLGLFSLLDVMLEVSMEAALDMVLVTDMIRQALLNKSGVFAPVLQMMTDYEAASWSSVSRQMIVYDIAEDDLSNAYLDALMWYRDLVQSEEPELEPEAMEA